MDILVDLRKLSYEPSGIGMYIYNFVSGMLKYSTINIFGITDVLESDQIKDLKNKGIKIFKYGKRVDKNLEVFKYFDFVNRMISINRPDIFWEPNQIIPKNLKRKNPKIKIMITIHDILPVTKTEYYTIKYRLYFKYFQRKTIKNSDLIIYVSNFSKKECNDYFEESKDKMNFTSYMIVDLPKYNFEVKDKSYFLYIGNLEERKGIHILLKAYELYLKKGGQKKLKIAGSIRDSNIKFSLDRLVKEYSNQIEYLGYIDEKMKIKLLSECSTFVFPSFAEGFGTPPVEALNFNKHVIVSNIKVFKEILKSNVTYFDISSNIERSSINLATEMANEKIECNNHINLYNSKKLVNDFIRFIGNYNK